MDLKLYETKFREVKLNKDQYHLWRLVIILKRECWCLSDLREEEVLDFHKNVVQKVENTLKKSFNATMFNWTCLMNSAYSWIKTQPHVHWHVKPRYNCDVEIKWKVFSDKDFWKHYDFHKKDYVDQLVLEEIKHRILQHL